MGPSDSPFTETLPAGSKFYQSFRRFVVVRGTTVPGSPLYMDSSNGSRFNSPNESFGATYLAESPAGAFLETFIRLPQIAGYSMEDVNDRRLATIEFTEALTLVKCYGNGLKRNGLTASVSSTDNSEYHASQNKSESWYQKSSADGVIYMSRLDNQVRCIALYDRAAQKVKVVHTMDWSDFSGFYDMMAHYALFEID